MENQENNNGQLQIELKEEEAQGTYCLLYTSVGRDKVLQQRQTFLKVRKNRVFDNLTAFGTCFLGLRHQTTHTGDCLLYTSRCV